MDIEKTSKTVNRYESLDFTIPIKTTEIMAKTSEDDCLGFLWDLRDLECAKCAERDICGILFNENVVKPNVAHVQEKQGAIFLDLTDFEGVDEKQLIAWVNSGVTTSKDLITYVMAKARTSDRIAAVEWIKRFVPATEGINIKSGIVWLS